MTESKTSRTWLVAGAFVAVALTVAAVTYSIAYRAGQAEERRQLEPYVGNGPPSGNPAGASSPGRPVSPGAGVSGSPTAPPPNPAETAGSSANERAAMAAPAPTPGGQPAAPAIGQDPRSPGMNYLELCTLTYRDGLQAVEFLGKNGLRAGLVPAQKSVDPAKAAENNAPHVVFLLDGIPSDRFRASEKERAALIKRVEDIGRRFQREQRGASDFSRPAWRLFRERDRN